MASQFPHTYPRSPLTPSLLLFPGALVEEASDSGIVTKIAWQEPHRATRPGDDGVVVTRWWSSEARAEPTAPSPLPAGMKSRSP